MLVAVRQNTTAVLTSKPVEQRLSVSQIECRSSKVSLNTLKLSTIHFPENGFCFSVITITTGFPKYQIYSPTGSMWFLDKSPTERLKKIWLFVCLKLMSYTAYYLSNNSKSFRTLPLLHLKNKRNTYNQFFSCSKVLQG